MAASSDTTGPVVLGGDEDLEVQSGVVEAQGVGVEGLAGVLSSINSAPAFSARSGVTITSISDAWDDNARSVILQTDGMILVAGTAFNGSGSDFALVRYNADGTLDMTFDGDGKLTTNIGLGYEDGFSSALDLHVHFVKENVVLSPDSRSTENVMHGIKVLMAKNYIGNLSEEIRKGMNQRAEQGISPTRAPIGHRNVLGPNAKKTIEPEAALAPMVLKLFEWYETGRFFLREVS